MIKQSAFISLVAIVFLSSCGSKPDSIDDVVEEVIQKDRGVSIDIEPGKKA